MIHLYKDSPLSTFSYKLKHNESKKYERIFEPIIHDAKIYGMNFETSMMHYGICAETVCSAPSFFSISIIYQKITQV